MAAWLNRALAFLVAWVMACVSFGLFDQLSGTYLTPYAIAWICFGIGLRLPKDSSLILPCEDHVDVTGAVLFLWHCACWPVLLIRW